MKAKSRNPKRPKNGGTDSITGAKFNLNGFTIESDKIYSGDSPIRSIFGTATLANPRLTNWSMEFEFGNPQFFIQTAKSTYIDELGRTTEFTERYISEGVFKYSNGRMTSQRSISSTVITTNLIRMGTRSRWDLVLCLIHQKVQS